MEFGQGPAIGPWKIGLTDVVIVEGSCVYIDQPMMNKASAAARINYYKNKCDEYIS